MFIDVNSSDDRKDDKLINHSTMYYKAQLKTTKSRQKIKITLSDEKEKIKIRHIAN